MDISRRDSTPVLAESTKEVSLRELFAPSSGQDTPDRAKAEIVKELMGKTNLNRVTELSNFDIAMLSSAAGINASVKSVIYEVFSEEFREMRVSNARKGRTEVVDLTKNTELQQQKQKSRWSFFP